jgi:predicted dehydrogenase/threonine dehydrogenase-like Zn-dependent dehydrogenase
MRQILLNMSGAVVAHVPRPIVGPGSVLVRVHYSLISVGTEIAPLRSASASAPDADPIDRARQYGALARHYAAASMRDPRKALNRILRIARQQVRRLPTPTLSASSTPAPAASERDAQGWAVGYSAAGEVIAVGEGVTDLAAGDLVACAGAGQANHADFINVKRNLVCRIPSGCDLALAASATVGAIALQGVRRAQPQLGEKVCVLGLGLLGQITAQLLRASGCDVVGLDLDPARVERARALGLAHGASDADALRQLVRDVTGGRGADQTIMTAATKSSAVINLAMDVTRAKGRVVIVGDVGLHAQRDVFYRKEIDLLMSTSYGPGRYDPSYEAEGHDYPFAYVRWTENRNMQSYLELIAGGRLDIRPLIDQVTSVEEAPAVYRALADAEGELPLGVVIHYPDETPGRPDRIDATTVVIRGHRKAPAGRINYALVGAGAFGTGMLVPQMDRCGGRYALTAVVSRNAAQGGNFARERGIETLTSTLDDVLRDPAIELVVIATRHGEHAAQVVKALDAGKHVFVEKPLALTWAELSSVARTYAAMAEPPALMVGFNRRFSPSLQLLKERLAGRRSPLMIQYRLNAGYIPLDHWVHGPQGGGRNIGEACHMYDVFRFLTGAPVKAIAAVSIDPGTLAYARNDNFCATVSYQDGSVAALTYTALGPKDGLGKEYITVFCDGDAYVVDDFRKLTRASDGAALWQSGEILKGHFEELSGFANALASGAPLIPFDELVETSSVALEVEDQLFGRIRADDGV